MTALKNPRHLYTKCPLCHSSDFTPTITADCREHPLYNRALPGDINWQKCSACGHGFTDGYFTQAALDILFATANDYQIPSLEIQERFRNLSAKMIDKVSSVLPEQKGKWLDVGFGNGVLLTTCEEYGFEPVGVDLRQLAVDRMKAFGYETYCREFTELSQFNTYTVISMADVLEHMPYPKEALTHAHKLLREDGLLFLSFPNADAFLWKALTQGNANPYWMEIEHYHNFGRKRIYELLNEEGFEAISYNISERYRIGMEVIARKI